MARNYVQTLSRNSKQVFNVLLSDEYYDKLLRENFSHRSRVSLVILQRTMAPNYSIHVSSGIKKLPNTDRKTCWLNTALQMMDQFGLAYPQNFLNGSLRSNNTDLVKQQAKSRWPNIVKNGADAAVKFLENSLLPQTRYTWGFQLVQQYFACNHIVNYNIEHSTQMNVPIQYGQVNSLSNSVNQLQQPGMFVRTCPQCGVVGSMQEWTKIVQVPEIELYSLPINSPAIPYSCSFSKFRDRKQLSFVLCQKVTIQPTKTKSHFYCYRKIGNSWFLADDHRVRKVSEQEVFNSPAILLFYSDLQHQQQNQYQTQQQYQHQLPQTTSSFGGVDPMAWSFNFPANNGIPENMEWSSTVSDQDVSSPMKLSLTQRNKMVDVPDKMELGQ